MKVLIVSHPCVTAINQQFYAEVERQTGWDLTIVTPSNWQNDYGQRLYPERWAEYRGNLLSLPVWKPGNIPLHTYRSTFIPLLNEIQPDFIYVQHEPYAVATAQVYLANRLSVRRPIGFFTWQNIFKHYPLPIRKTESWVLQATDVAFPGSVSAEAVLRQKGYQGNAVLLPGSVDPQLYSHYPVADALKQKLQTHDQEILIGYVGRIVEEKGLKTLLYALQQLPDLPWRLVMLGAGAYEAEFDAIAQKLHLSDRIRRLGYISHAEAPLYLAAFDALVLPSETRPNWKEQFGRVIIEAMACGTPVIGSTSGEIPHLIQSTGGGLTFPEANPTALAEQLRQIILNSQLRQTLAAHGKQRVLQDYTNATLTQRFVHSIEQVVSAKDRASDRVMQLL
ncbi:MAG: glycosyltransferase family 4 protein [Scytolyngbya sp. HA4215-MV1]|nr:glycosyltransferase family 4 protein [Scytolyngbya sp. HA4215-MV1]